MVLGRMRQTHGARRPRPGSPRVQQSLGGGINVLSPSLQQAEQSISIPPAPGPLAGFSLEMLVALRRINDRKTLEIILC